MLTFRELQRRLVLVRTILVAIGGGAAAIWLIALVDGSTTWLTWLTGAMALGCFALVPLDRTVPSAGAAALEIVPLGGLALVAFAAALASDATSWLSWAMLPLAGGLLAAAALALLLGLGPSAESRRPIGEL